MKYFVLASMVLFFSTFSLSAQEDKKTSGLPSASIKTLDGKTISSTELNNEGKPFIISFWASWCKPCLKELNAIKDVYEEWQEETGVKLIAVSIDDARTSSKVNTLVNGSSWDYEVYLDMNQDFKRAMNVTNIPHIFIVNGNGEIVWQTTAMVDGGENQLIELVKKIIAGEDISNEK